MYTITFQLIQMCMNLSLTNITNETMRCSTLTLQDVVSRYFTVNFLQLNESTSCSTFIKCINGMAPFRGVAVTNQLKTAKIPLRVHTLFLLIFNTEPLVIFFLSCASVSEERRLQRNDI